MFYEYDIMHIVPVCSLLCSAGDEAGQCGAVHMCKADL